jgi:hypothetical protein
MNYKFHGTTRPNDSHSGSQRFILTQIACFSSVLPGKCRDGNLKYVTNNSFYILLYSRFTIHRVTRRYTKKKFSLSTPWWYIEGAGTWIQPFLTSAIDENGNSTPRPGNETWCTINRSLDGLECRSGQFFGVYKISCPYQHSDPGPSSPQPSRYSAYAIPTHFDDILSKKFESVIRLSNKCKFWRANM